MRTTFWVLLGAAVIAGVLGGCRAPAPGGANAAFGGAARVEHALVGKIYFLPSDTQRLPDFHTLKPVGQIYARQLNVPDQDFQVGFPGVTNRFEWFGIDYSGFFTVTTPARYAFRLSSDDGTKLFIDGQKVIDNDGVHPTTSASGAVDLKAGRHDIEVQYFQGPRYRVSLQFYCTAPGGAETLFPGCGLNLVEPFNWTLWIVLALVALAVIVIAVVVARRPKPASQATAPEGG